MARGTPWWGEPTVTRFSTVDGRVPWAPASTTPRRATTPPWEWAMTSMGTPGSAAATWASRSSRRWADCSTDCWLSGLS